MGAQFRAILDFVYSLVWGTPLLVLVIGVGLFYTIALRGLQFRYLKYGLKLAFGKHQDKESQGDISHFQSLMTALAATIGIGNIAGIATAIASGGMGAIFWMWVTALVGMSIKYAEAILAVKYRITDGNGQMAGGPMYFIERGAGMKWLAALFALFGAIAALGGGNMLQANSVADVLQKVFSLDPLFTAILLAIATGLSILGGITTIGRVASLLVPFMAFCYISGSLYVILSRIDRIPHALYSIFTCAFSGQAAFGGFLGATIAGAIQVGVSRGLMTSEAGLGTASIAAASAKTDHPGRQAIVSMTGSFLATIVMCSMTALVLGVTDAFGTLGPNGTILNGASMTVVAFNSVVSWGGYIVSLGLILFAFTTLIGWAYYGEKCVEYLFGIRSVLLYRLIFILFVAIGALLQLEVVWRISDIFNGLMAFPNLLGLLLLSKEVVRDTRGFLSVIEKEKVEAFTA
jgi:alanine or glycine:cation symporter, AGCS family